MSERPSVTKWDLRMGRPSGTDALNETQGCRLPCVIHMALCSRLRSVRVIRWCLLSVRDHQLATT